MRHTHRGLGVAGVRMECCISQESHSRPSYQPRLMMHRNSGRHQRKGNLHGCPHLVSGVGQPHMSTLRHRRRPRGVRREDHEGEWTCPCASHGTRLTQFPPKRLNEICQRRHRGNEQEHTDRKPSKKRRHLPSWSHTSLPVH